MDDHKEQLIKSTTTSTIISEDSIRKTFNKLRPCKLYGTKKNLDRIRELLPYYVEPIEFPECFFNEEMMDKFILVDTSTDVWKL